MAWFVNLDQGCELMNIEQENTDHSVSIFSINAATSSMHCIHRCEFLTYKLINI